MDALDIDLVLVPVDGSEESADAVEYAVAVAGKYDAAVHAVYVVGKEVVRAIDSGAVDEAEVADESEEFAEVVEGIATGGDVSVTTSLAYGFSQSRLSQHPGSVILDTAEDVDADFLVVPREPGTGASEVLEKAAEYVLLYASQPVLSV